MNRTQEQILEALVRGPASPRDLARFLYPKARTPSGKVPVFTLDVVCRQLRGLVALGRVTWSGGRTTVAAIAAGPTP